MNRIYVVCGQKLNTNLIISMLQLIPNNIFMSRSIYKCIIKGNNVSMNALCLNV